MKRLLLSLGTIGVVGSIALAATGAFFSDTEVSQGNVLGAGDINLQIGNESYAIDWNIPGYVDPIGALVASANTSWTLTDLTVEKFFDFVDLKPGDYGEDTITVEVGSNDAWVCAAAQITEDNDNTYVDPELEDDSTVEADPATTDGELDEEVQFAFWVDDGDNVFEQDETIFLSGPLSNLDNAGQIALADSTQSVLGGTTPIPGGDSFFIGKIWCFGELTETPVPNTEDTNPVTREATGFACDGSQVSNAAQTDIVQGDLQFYAVQSRNNADFTCSQWTPEWPEESEPEGEVGASLGGYTALNTVSDCDVVVADEQSIQSAIDGASAGNTICVQDGFHDSDTYPLRVNKDNLTLAAVNGPTNSAELEGGVIIDNDGVTVTGFIINDSTLLSETFGVYINTGVDNATVSYNDINGPSTSSGRGVVNATGTTSNALIANNDISNWLTAVFLNPSSGMIVEYNTLTGNGVGSGNDNPDGNIVRYNHITGNSAEGVGVFLTGSNSISVNFNNIFSNNGEDLNNYGSVEADAENNWWGDTTPADTINVNASASGPVDFDPYESSAYLTF